MNNSNYKTIDDLSIAEIDAIRNKYWETDSFVDRIALDFNIKKNDVFKIAGEKSVKCTCGKNVITIHRISRQDRYATKCLECLNIVDLKILSTEINYLKDMLLELSEFSEQRRGTHEYNKKLSSALFDIFIAIDRSKEKIYPIYGIKNLITGGVEND